MAVPVPTELSNALVGPTSILVSNGTLLCNVAYADAVANELGNTKRLLVFSNGQGVMEAALKYRLWKMELHAVVSGCSNTHTLFSTNAPMVPLLTVPAFKDYDAYLYDPLWDKSADRFRAMPVAYREPLQNILAFGKLTVVPLSYFVDISWFLMVNAEAFKSFGVRFERVENNYLVVFTPHSKSKA